MRSQRERDVIRDVRLALKAEHTERTLPDLLAEYKALCPSRPDVLFDIAVAAFGKDNLLAEKAFRFIAERGSMGGPAGDLNYASALVYLAILPFLEGKEDEAYKMLNVAQRYTGAKIPMRGGASNANSNVGSGGKDTGGGGGGGSGGGGGGAIAGGGNRSMPDMVDRWENLNDFVHFFLAMCAYRNGHPGDAMRHFDGLSSYQLVLEPRKYALLVLVKAHSFIQSKQFQDALTALDRRQSQEDAYAELQTLSHSSKARPGPVVKEPATPGSPKEAASGGAKPNVTDPLVACHDLHIVLLSRQEKQDALALFKLVKKDYPRGTFDSFVQAHSDISAIGRDLILGWRPVFPDLSAKRAAAL